MTVTDKQSREARQEREDFPGTLRDYFAGQVLMGLAANDAYYDETAGTVAEIAYRQADAMLKARGEAS